MFALPQQTPNLLEYKTSAGSLLGRTDLSTLLQVQSLEHLTLTLSVSSAGEDGGSAGPSGVAGCLRQVDSGDQLILCMVHSTGAVVPDAL